MRVFHLIGILPLALAQLPSLSLPPLLGPYKIGTRTYYLPGRKSQSPPRDIMISLFYPTISNINTTTYPIAPAYDPAYASFLEASYGLPSGLAAGIKSQAYLNAPISPTIRDDKDCKLPHSNIILFSPGYGGSRLDYTATLSNLASRGYIVVGVDHPNDTAFISYPDGRTLIYHSVALNETTAAQAVDLRVKDLRFVLDALSSTPNIIPGSKGKLTTNRVLVYGHSLGGATSAAAILSDRRFIAGANFDGALWGPVVERGIRDAPFLIIAAEGHNATNDDTWARFWKNSRGGYEGEIQVRGARHGSFSDFGVLYGILRQLGLIADLDPTGELLGTIGERALVVEDAYLTAFARLAVTGKQDKLLKGPSDAFPECMYSINSFGREIMGMTANADFESNINSRVSGICEGLKCPYSCWEGDYTHRHNLLANAHCWVTESWAYIIPQLTHPRDH